LDKRIKQSQIPSLDRCCFLGLANAILRRLSEKVGDNGGILRMSQTDIYKLLSDKPKTQYQLSEVTGMSTGQVGHELRCLIKKGMVIMKILESKGRPYGYTKASTAPERHPIKWPKY